MSTPIKRYQIADYLECGTGAEKNYCLCGTGYKSLNESPSAQVIDTIYVSDKCSSSDIDSYQTSFAFEADMLADEVAAMEVYKIGRNHAVGEDAQRNYVRVDLYDPANGSENTFHARKFKVAVEVSSMSGESGKTMGTSGNFRAIGDFIEGTFNTQTKTFTATTE